MYGYLFAHFVGEQKNGEQIYFSLSRDGLRWEDLNDGKPVIQSDIGTKGLRDPFLIRSVEGNKFFLVATDLCIGSGTSWGDAVNKGSTKLFICQSEDLVHWSEGTLVDIGVEGSGCAWAPECIYDEKRKEYMIFWASYVEGKHRIYQFRTRDFKSFTDSSLYIEKSNDVIDTTIVKAGQWYYRFSKDETKKCITIEKGMDLLGDFEEVESDTLDNLLGVEGPIVTFLEEKNKWCLLVDRFATGKGYLPLITEDIGSGDFKVLDLDEYYMGRSIKRHGGIIQISEEEYKRLEKAFGKRKIENPILPGLYADPDIAVFNGKYYIYPTTDGFDGWSGSKFYVFSSEDKIHWNNEGLILDLSTDDVKWAVGYAWAPAITEKEGKYYFYFCGKKQDGESAIGVAVADRPEGPFKAEDTPILTKDMVEDCGIDICQVIDPSVYVENGEYYLLFGNGTGVVGKLSGDMKRVMPETMRKLEGLYDFREAVTVFKEMDRYHFTWSCDDTGSENYHINYGVSESLFGPVNFIKTILSKSPEINQLGTGHHSIAKDGDKYIIAYHRFATPLSLYKEGKGFKREVCLGEVSFDEKGNILKVVRM